MERFTDETARSLAGQRVEIRSNNTVPEVLVGTIRPFTRLSTFVLTADGPQIVINEKVTAWKPA